MKININTIPVGGRSVEFEIPSEGLNSRLGGDGGAGRGAPTGRQLAAAQKGKSDAVKLGKTAVRGTHEIGSPIYTFETSPSVSCKLTLEGSTVMFDGASKATYKSVCSRCAEEIEKSVEIPLNLILKPASSRAQEGEEDEDLSIAFYHGDEINCGQVVEDFIVLALPFSVLCSDDCKGLCPSCGVNLNTTSCACKETAKATEQGIPDSPFRALKQLLH